MIQVRGWSAGDRIILTLGIVLGVGVLIVAGVGYVYELDWTGISKTDYPKRTFWDWLKLLLVPVVLGIGGYIFRQSESRRSQEIADQQRAVDREIADQRQQGEALEAYFQNIGTMLTDYRLTDAPNDTVRLLATGQTLTVLTRLGAQQKGNVVLFLYGAQLIRRADPIVSLDRADLTNADLSRGYLREANLSGAHLRGADLQGVELQGADLRGADLQRANLQGADLRGAHVGRANLREANLHWGNLDDAVLNDAVLDDATMPNGQKYEDWLKDKEG